MGFGCKHTGNVKREPLIASITSLIDHHSSFSAAIVASSEYNFIEDSISMSLHGGIVLL